VLVTGASGFFGPEIVARLRTAGHEVIGASRSGRKAAGTLAMDITSRDSCERAFEAAGAVEVVVHAAALAHVKPGRIPEGLCRSVNTQGTANVVDAAARVGVGRFVFISSVMVYGDFELPLRAQETDVCQPRGIYGEAKLAAEAICQGRGEFDAVHVLRMATMYSPEWLSNIRKRVRPIVRGRPVYFTLDPLGRRYTLCSRRNGAEAVRWSVEQRLPPGVYNVADHYEYCQQDILRAVERADGPGWRLPIPLALPRALWHLVRLTMPNPRWRENAHSRYWKFCEHNLYSAEKLRQCGFDASPDLLAIGAPR
jgi:UDP-glucose 4-epimerase